MGMMWSRVTCPVCNRSWIGEFSYNPREPSMPPEYMLCSQCKKYIKKALRATADKIENSGIFRDVEEWITEISEEYWHKKAMDIINNFSEIIDAEFSKIDFDPFGEKPEASVIFYINIKTKKGVVPARLNVHYIFKGWVSGLIAIGRGFKFNGVRMSFI